MDYIFLIVIVVAMFGMMFWQSKKAKQQQAERQDFRANLQPGTEVTDNTVVAQLQHLQRTVKATA